MLSSKYFKKRTYTFSTFFKDICTVMRKSSHIRESMQAERISGKFREKIMLAVTAVNGCKYCEWGHTKAAMEEGCTEEEIKEIMENDFGSCDPDEVIALAFAQHYADSKGNYTEDSWTKLVDVYGEKEAEDILLSIQMITVGNLLGNTFDGFLSRFKGKPPENGSLMFELFLLLSFIIFSPLMVIIIIIILPFIIILKKCRKGRV